MLIKNNIRAKAFLLLMICFLLGPSLMAKSIDRLKTNISSLLKTEEGIFAVAFKSVSGSGDSLFINEKMQFHAASTMKTPVMIEAFNQHEQGIINLADSLTIHNSFKSIVDGSPFKLQIERDSGDKLYASLGKKAAIYDLVYDMIINSSNLATNIVIDLLDAKKVTATMKELNAPTLNVLRGVEDMKAYNAGLSNSTSAKDLCAIYEKIALKQAVSTDASTKMIAVLLDQKHNDIIPAQLPKHIKVAHKTGSISGVRHDSGIVFLENGSAYVLVLLSKELKNPEQAVKTLAAVSRLIYDFAVEK